jgi:hypothetical protein
LRFDPAELRKLGAQLETELTAIFKAARYKLNAEPRDVQPDSYTMFAFPAAMMYTQLIEFADQDLIDKSKRAIDVHDRMEKAAGSSPRRSPSRRDRRGDADGRRTRGPGQPVRQSLLSRDQHRLEDHRAGLATFGEATMNGADDMLKGALNYLLAKRTSEVFGRPPFSHGIVRGDQLMVRRSGYQERHRPV